MRVEDDVLEVGGREEALPLLDPEAIVEHDGDVGRLGPNALVGVPVELLQEFRRDRLRSSGLLRIDRGVASRDVGDVPDLLRDRLVEHLDAPEARVVPVSAREPFEDG